VSLEPLLRPAIGQSSVLWFKVRHFSTVLLSESTTSGGKVVVATTLQLHGGASPFTIVS
jgi:hypothetical protein